MKKNLVLMTAAGLVLGAAGVAMGQATNLQFCTPYTPGTPAIPGTVQLSWSGAIDSASPTARGAGQGNGNELAPAGPFAFQSATVTNVSRYSTFSFVAPGVGSNPFRFFSAQAFDGYANLYNGAFDPLNPLTNLIAGDDDMGTLNGGVVPNRNGVPNAFDSGFQTNLVGGNSYTFVTRTFSQNATGGTLPVAPNNVFYNEIRDLGTAAVPATPTYAIPDNTATGITIDLVIPNTETRTITGFNSVDLINLTHSWVGDLVITLTHVESGLTVDIIDRVDKTATATFGNDGNLAGDYSIADGATAWPDVAAITPGTYAQTANSGFGSSTADGSLAAFIGTPLAGTWRLSVSDLGSGDTGSISAFCLNVAVPAPGSLALLGMGGLLAARRRRN